MDCLTIAVSLGAIFLAAIAYIKDASHIANLNLQNQKILLEIEELKRRLKEKEGRIHLPTAEEIDSILSQHREFASALKRRVVYKRGTIWRRAPYFLLLIVIFFWCMSVADSRHAASVALQRETDIRHHATQARLREVLREREELIDAESRLMRVITSLQSKPVSEEAIEELRVQHQDLQSRIERANERIEEIRRMLGHYDEERVNSVP